MRFFDSLQQTIQLLHKLRILTLRHGNRQGLSNQGRLASIHRPHILAILAPAAGSAGDPRVETFAVLLLALRFLAVAEPGLVVGLPSLRAHLLLNWESLAVVQGAILAVEAPAGLGAPGAGKVALAVLFHAFGFLAIAALIIMGVFGPNFLAAFRLF